MLRALKLLGHLGFTGLSGFSGFLGLFGFVGAFRVCGPFKGFRVGRVYGDFGGSRFGVKQGMLVCYSKNANPKP